MKWVVLNWILNIMKIKLEKFEGPLDLLCQLIDSQKLDITEVALAEVAEQYIEYLDEIEEVNPEDLADFLVVASRLLYLKSRALLPGLDSLDEDTTDLEEQLKLYKKFYDASKLIEKILDKGEMSFARKEERAMVNYKFVPRASLNTELLKKTLLGIIGGIEVKQRLPERSMKEVISIKQKIQEIRDVFRDRQEAGFGDVLKDSSNRKEVIISFLGLLELVKQRYIHIDQGEMFGSIVIRKKDI